MVTLTNSEDHNKMQHNTVKHVLRGHLKRGPKLVFKTSYRLMQVKGITEYSKRAFCNTFDLHKATIVFKTFLFLF